jgi:hypothetical protein
MSIRPAMVISAASRALTSVTTPSTSADEVDDVGSSAPSWSPPPSSLQATAVAASARTRPSAAAFFRRSFS